MAVGTDGNSGHILIDEMVADGSVESKYFLGVLETTVANGGFARVISFGQLDQFNTLGQNGETWNDGDILWCDPDSDGDFTITEPDGPNLKIPAAIVLNAATNGKIQVRVQANEGIHDLYDTKIVNQVDGDILVWDNTTGVWFNDSTLNVDYTNNVIDITGNLDVSDNVTLGNSNEIRFKNSANNAVGVMSFYSDNTLRIFNGNSTNGNIEFRDGSSTGTLNASIRGSDGKFLANFGADITGNLDVSGTISLGTRVRPAPWQVS